MWTSSVARSPITCTPIELARAARDRRASSPSVSPAILPRAFCAYCSARPTTQSVPMCSRSSPRSRRSSSLREWCRCRREAAPPTACLVFEAERMAHRHARPVPSTSPRSARKPDRVARREDVGRARLEQVVHVEIAAPCPEDADRLEVRALRCDLRAPLRRGAARSRASRPYSSCVTIVVADRAARSPSALRRSSMPISPHGGDELRPPSRRRGTRAASRAHPRASPSRRARRTCTAYSQPITPPPRIVRTRAASRWTRISSLSLDVRIGEVDRPRGSRDASRSR